MSDYVETVTLSGKTSDMFGIHFQFNDGRGKSGDGYAPPLDNVCSGDYFHIQVDNETGRIIGWVPVKYEEVDALLRQM